MKKLILVAAGLGLSFVGMAQKKNVTTATQALTHEEYDDAKKAIDDAVLDASTKDDPKAWSVRGDVYLTLIEKGKLTEAQGLDIATQSYLKAVALKPDYQKEDMDQKLLNIALRYYNIGGNDYNEKKYDEASAALKVLIDIHGLDNGKRFAGKKTFDTVAVQSQEMRGYSAYYGNKYAEAETIIQGIKSDPIVKSPNLYLMLIDMYKKENKDQQVETTVAEGRKEFPDDKNLRNEELNIYLKNPGKQDELVKKLEDAAANEKEPKAKAELLYNVGNSYMSMAFPKDAQGKDMKKAANYKDLVAKAESNYQQALTLDADKPDYQYNMGVLYFNQATEINNQMNAINGTSAPELKKFDDLKKDRDAMFGKAVPYLEKTFNTLDAKSSTLSEDDKFTYQSSIIALREIYVKTNQTAKATAMKAKYDALKK